MRLLLVNYEYPPLGGGAGNATRFFSKELVQLGCQVCVLTSAFGDLPSQEQTDGFEVIRIPTWRKHADRCTPVEMLAFTTSALWRVKTITTTFRPDVCLSFFGIPCGPVGLALKWRFHVPYAVLLRGGDVPGFQPRELALFHRLTGPCIRFLWHQANAVIANSTGLRDLALSSAPDVSIDIVENGVDGQLFSPVISHNEDTKPENYSPVNVLSVGRLTHQKGMDIALRALAECAKTLSTPWRFTIVGDGPKRAELEALAIQLGIAENITFYGWASRNELPDIYRQADLFVFSSRDEGMSNAVLEAMASGLPVIATRIAGNEELIDSERSGLLVEKDDIPELSHALARCIENRQMRLRMGKTARQRTEELYTWNAAAKKLLHICQRLQTSNNHKLD
ncbi:glycosyltransferase family 4 protein [Desulfovibrio inopinatus]|uniref:glycosyltransferase family 4 protein n=1 Tax=Desulfovibrio inopinatus TaxID=102109 RepID=UPI0003FF7BF4|nr:glycosyltransferase family 4 protein [Desulfovibrio inopinatus]